jgi:hypothetical protein
MRPPARICWSRMRRPERALTPFPAQRQQAFALGGPGASPAASASVMYSTRLICTSCIRWYLFPPVSRCICGTLDAGEVLKSVDCCSYRKFGCAYQSFLARRR